MDAFLEMESLRNFDPLTVDTYLDVVGIIDACNEEVEINRVPGIDVLPLRYKLFVLYG